MTRKLLLATLFLFLGQQTYADTGLNFTGLQQGQVEAIMDTFAAGLAFKSLEPPSAFGHYWGVAGGLTVTLSSTTRIQANIPNVGTAFLPSGNLNGDFQAPFGLAGEVGWLPDVNGNGFHERMFGADLKWTINQVFFTASPVDFALRAMWTTASEGYTASVTGGTMNVAYDGTSYGANFNIGVPVLILQPYIGAGWIHQSAVLSASGQAQITSPFFNSAISTSGSFGRESSALWLDAGMQVKLLIFTGTLEYNRLFDVDTYSAKLGFKI